MTSSTATEAQKRRLCQLLLQCVSDEIILDKWLTPEAVETLTKEAASEHITYITMRQNQAMRLRRDAR